jgi:hypothetical protein
MTIRVRLPITHKSGRHTLWLVSPTLLLCPRTPHILVLRPSSLHLRPLTLRVTHPMAHQDLWVLHTGSEYSITVAFTTTSLTFLKTCKTALQRNVHRIYLSGGLCKPAFHGRQRSLTYVCLVEKSSQLPPPASCPALPLLARL